MSGLRRETFSFPNFFSFSTVESNRIAAFAFLVTGVAALRSSGRETFALLRRLEASSQTPVLWVNTAAAPPHAAGRTGRLVYRPAGLQGRFRRVAWIAFPAAYGAYSLPRGAVVGWYPHPFLNPGEQGYARVVLTCAVMLVPVVGLAARLTARTRSGKRRPQAL